jgi:hypothetical protein
LPEPRQKPSSGFCRSKSLRSGRVDQERVGDVGELDVRQLGPRPVERRERERGEREPTGGGPRHVERTDEPERLLGAELRAHGPKWHDEPRTKGLGPRVEAAREPDGRPHGRTAELERQRRGALGQALELDHQLGARQPAVEGRQHHGGGRRDGAQRAQLERDAGDPAREREPDGVDAHEGPRTSPRRAAHEGSRRRGRGRIVRAHPARVIPDNAGGAQRP